MDWNNLKNLTFYTMIESLDYFLDDTIKIEILDKTLLYVRNKIIFNSTNIILFKIGLSFFKIEKIERAESLFIESFF